MTGRNPEAGVTLIEMMVALALFALIGGAGFAMLDQVLRTQSRTEGRLEHLGRMQRAMYLIGVDLAMVAPRGLDASALPALRLGRSDGLQLRYWLEDGTLRRAVLDDAGVMLADQPLLDGVSAADWRFAGAAGWVGFWPEGAVLPGPAQNPAAAELTLTLEGGRVLRRVALLPQGG